MTEQTPRPGPFAAPPGGAAEQDGPTLEELADAVANLSATVAEMQDLLGRTVSAVERGQGLKIRAT